MGDEKSQESQATSNERSTTEPERHRGVALLLSAAAVLAALIGGRAAVLSSNGSTAWQEGTRQKVKEAAAYVESIRYIYGVEVPRAVLVTETRFRVEELSEIPQASDFSANTRHSIAIEQETQRSVLDQVQEGSTLASDAAYRTENGFDPVAMLKGDRENLPALLEVDPHQQKEEGDRLSEQAIRLIACSIFVAFAFLFGSLARGFPQRRRLMLLLGTVFLGAGVVAAIVVQVA